MFTGLISGIGRVGEIKDNGTYAFVCPVGWLANITVGDSIAVDGACLTVTALDLSNHTFCADVSAETRARCAPWQKEAAINLEQALRVGDSLGGHFVSGHIDGCATVTDIQTENSDDDDNDGGCRLQLRPPPALLPLIAEKGAVALAGVSLTVNTVADNTFSVLIIPYTRQHTTLGGVHIGQEVNIEADILARHLARLTKTPAKNR